MRTFLFNISDYIFLFFFQNTLNAHDAEHAETKKQTRFCDFVILWFFSGLYKTSSSSVFECITSCRHGTCVSSSRHLSIIFRHLIKHVLIWLSRWRNESRIHSWNSPGRFTPDWWGTPKALVHSPQFSIVDSLQRIESESETMPSSRVHAGRCSRGMPRATRALEFVSWAIAGFIIVNEWEMNNNRCRPELVQWLLSRAHSLTSTLLANQYSILGTSNARANSVPRRQ